MQIKRSVRLRRCSNKYVRKVLYSPFDNRIPNNSILTEDISCTYLPSLIIRVRNRFSFVITLIRRSFIRIPTYLLFTVATKTVRCKRIDGTNFAPIAYAYLYLDTKICTYLRSNIMSKCSVSLGGRSRIRYSNADIIRPYKSYFAECTLGYVTIVYRLNSYYNVWVIYLRVFYDTYVSE